MEIRRVTTDVNSPRTSPTVITGLSQIFSRSNGFQFFSTIEPAEERVEITATINQTIFTNHNVNAKVQLLQLARTKVTYLWRSYPTQESNQGAARPLEQCYRTGWPQARWRSCLSPHSIAASTGHDFRANHCCRCECPGQSAEMKPTRRHSAVARIWLK